MATSIPIREREPWRVRVRVRVSFSCLAFGFGASVRGLIFSTHPVVLSLLWIGEHAYKDGILFWDILRVGWLGQLTSGSFPFSRFDPLSALVSCLNLSHSLYTKSFSAPLYRSRRTFTFCSRTRLVCPPLHCGNGWKAWRRICCEKIQPTFHRSNKTNTRLQSWSKKFAPGKRKKIDLHFAPAPHHQSAGGRRIAIAFLRPVWVLCPSIIAFVLSNPRESEGVRKSNSDGARVLVWAATQPTNPQQPSRSNNLFKSLGHYSTLPVPSLVRSYRDPGIRYDKLYEKGYEKESSTVPQQYPLHT